MSEPRYKRFCSVCRRVTYDFVCCGKRTRRVNLQSTMGDIEITIGDKLR